MSVNPDSLNLTVSGRMAVIDWLRRELLGGRHVPEKFWTKPLPRLGQSRLELLEREGFVKRVLGEPVIKTAEFRALMVSKPERISLLNESVRISGVVGQDTPFVNTPARKEIMEWMDSMATDVRSEIFFDCAQVIERLHDLSKILDRMRPAGSLNTAAIEGLAKARERRRLIMEKKGRT